MICKIVVFLRLEIKKCYGNKNVYRKHKDRFRDEWFSLLRIPSVSSQSEHKADMVKCAERWKELLLASGATRAEVMPTAGNPVVYAEHIVSASGREIGRASCRERV